MTDERYAVERRTATDHPAQYRQAPSVALSVAIAAAFPVAVLLAAHPALLAPTLVAAVAASWVTWR